ncbi:hypothetical protein D918_04883 [Trichuris suis]|nr:hypothetical protein D918_04883 [Trichuris suis]
MTEQRNGASPRFRSVSLGRPSLDDDRPVVNLTVDPRRARLFRSAASIVVTGALRSCHVKDNSCFHPSAVRHGQNCCLKIATQNREYGAYLVHSFQPLLKDRWSVVLDQEALAQ